MGKTVMQELLDSLIHQSNGCTRDTRGSERYILSGIIDFAKQLLEKEKQQIIDAYNNGTQQNSPPMEGSQYYNQTYNQK